MILIVNDKKVENNSGGCIVFKETINHFFGKTILRIGSVSILVKLSSGFFLNLYLIQFHIKFGKNTSFFSVFFLFCIHQFLFAVLFFYLCSTL